MRRHLTLYGLLFAIVGFLSVSAFAVYAQSTGTIKGKVTGENSEPLNNVRVTLYAEYEWMGEMMWNYFATADTDDAGLYTFSDIGSGTYRLGFESYAYPRVYFPEYYNDQATVTAADDIVLAAGQTIANLDAQLSTGAHITGVVTGPGNVRLQGIKVAIGNNNFYGEAYTDSDGSYDVGSLEAGTYWVSFHDDRGQPQYGDELYDNAPNWNEPTPVTVTTNQILTNINAELERLAVIKGKVTNSSGNPVADVTVMAEAAPTAPDFMWSERQQAYTDATGAYTLTSLYADVYRIAFRDQQYKRYSSEYYNDVYDPAAATPLTVTFNSTTTNINAQLAASGGITGILTNSAGQPVEGVLVTAEEYYQLHTGNYSWRTVSSGYSNNDGHYALCCLSQGSYRLYFTDMYTRYTLEYYKDVLYTLANGPETVTMVQVTATLTTTNINAQLNRYSVLAGAIIDHHGRPAPGVTVQLYRTIDGFWQQSYSGITDEAGHYRVEAPPGIYRAHYYDNQIPNRYLPQYYANATEVDTATDISLTDEATTTVDITLTALGRITGTITDEQGKPVSNIRVSGYIASNLPEEPWTWAANTTSDENGHYSLGGLQDNTYRLSFADSDYPPLYNYEYYNNKTSLADANEIVIEGGVTVTNINAQLSRLAQIKGRVTDANNNPIFYASAAFYRYTVQANANPSWEYVAESYTDQNGNYQSRGLEPGQYRIAFPWYGLDYQSEWYDNVGYDVAAKTITVTGSTVLTVNAQLASEPFTWPPLAESDALTVTEGGTATQLAQAQSSILHNDLADSGNSLQANIVANPQHGQLTLNTDGTFTYTHDGGEATSDFFTYRANDGAQQSNIATVTITIVPVNDPPVAVDDTATVLRGGTVTTLSGGATSVLANDSDADDATLAAAVVTNPQHGTLTLNSDGTFGYTHNGDSAASDSFTYRARDSFNAADTATVTITINDEAPLTFSKTVSIEGIKPRCTAIDEIKAPVGTTIVYCYTVRNNGTQPATNHTLIDSHLGQLLTDLAHSLAPGATYSTTFTQTLTVTTTNVATWTASVAQPVAVAQTPQVISAQKSATVHISGPNDDSDQDTIPDNLEKAGDVDQDNIPNFLDTDADGDGVGDQAEVGSSPLQPQDSNNDGIPDYLDATIQTGGSQQLYLPLIHR